MQRVYSSLMIFFFQSDAPNSQKFCVAPFFHKSAWNPKIEKRINMRISPPSERKGVGGKFLPFISPERSALLGKCVALSLTYSGISFFGKNQKKKQCLSGQKLCVYNRSRTHVDICFFIYPFCFPFQRYDGGHNLQIHFVGEISKLVCVCISSRSVDLDEKSECSIGFHI